MSFLKRHKTAVALVAVLAVSAGAVHFSNSGCPLSGSGLCPLSACLSTSVAYAGPGCSKSGVCDADSKTKATTASATTADGKTCSKEDCVKAIMAEKKVSRDEAEAIYAKAVSSGSCHGSATNASFANSSGCSASKASAQTASASGCSGQATTASFANATESKTCGDKEACIAKCMAEKGYTRAEAEACYEKCQADKAKAIQANVVTGSSYTREAWVDAKVASGMSRPDAEVAAAKAEASGDVKFVPAVQTVGASESGCAVSTANASTKSCCAGKAKASTAEAKPEEIKPAAATAASTGGSE